MTLQIPIILPIVMDIFVEKLKKILVFIIYMLVGWLVFNGTFNTI